MGAGWVGYGHGRQPEGPGRAEAPLISFHAHCFPLLGGLFPPPAWGRGGRDFAGKWQIWRLLVR